MKTILIVDDEIHTRMILKEELEAEGYEVLTADTGREAIKILENPSLTVNLLITDLCHPEIDGIDLLFITTERWPSLPVICFTAHYEFFKSSWIIASAAAFILKSSDFTELKNSINKLVGQNLN